MATQATIESLMNQINSGKLKTNTAKILDSIIKNEPVGISTHQLEKEYYDEMKQSTVTSRLSNLTDLGLIYVSGERKIDETLYSVYKYETNTFLQKQRANLRKEQKLKGILQRVIKEFNGLISYDLHGQICQQIEDLEKESEFNRLSNTF